MAGDEFYDDEITSRLVEPFHYGHRHGLDVEPTGCVYCDAVSDAIEQATSGGDTEVVLRRHESGDGYSEPHVVGWEALTKSITSGIWPSPAEALTHLRSSE